MQVANLVESYVDYRLRADPIEASKLGVHNGDAELPSADPDAVAAHLTELRRYLALLEEVDPGSLPPPVWLDWRTAIISGRSEIRRAEDCRIERRAPYWHAERLGQSLSVLMLRDYAPIEARGQSLVSRLTGIPGYLRTAAGQLDETSPPIYVEMGITATLGLAAFLDGPVADFSGRLSEGLRNDLLRARTAALEAVEDFLITLRSLRDRARGSWRAGPEHFDFLLKEFHLLDIDHRQLHEVGRERIETDRRRLEEYARKVAPDRPWQEQIRRIKDRHPEPSDFVEAYRTERNRARAITLSADLATVPEGEECRMGWVPEYLRSSLPIAVMSTAPPFEEGLVSEWLITPSDPSAPPEARLEQMRDNCYAFAESIAGHETYPGHHLQKVHHKLATVGSPMRRYFSSPLLVEGWGLYTEDLLDEIGFFNNPDVMLFRLRNTLWRSVRVVVDTGLHAGSLTFEDAVAMLREEAALDTHMAEGEIKRYVRHDDATYPSAYLLGCREIHRLRESWSAMRGVVYTHREFHDRLLSYGSIPISLISSIMLA